MAFGKKRLRRKRKVGGLVVLSARRKAKEKLIAKQEKELDQFKARHPEFGEALDEIRAKAADGYQRECNYDVADHLSDVFELALNAGTQRKLMMRELDAIFSRRSGANRYLSLMKAASVPSYNEKLLSKSAKRVQGAIKDGIRPENFEDYRKGFGKRDPKTPED
ncbi:hypothetical protein [Bradyrhizobium tunisiense]|jgi:hypothetical protein|uniref:hypothetical protein n=1 Tax=Bradyrhizobium tunisiense TaxID=3278709 RepID=UPI0035D71881